MTQRRPRDHQIPRDIALTADVRQQGVAPSALGYLNLQQFQDGRE
jgi:hypothetical protein